MKAYLKSAQAHIEARKNSNFDLQTVANKQELIQALKDGKTIHSLLEEIEIRFTSITSIILSQTLFHESHNYKSGVNKGFKKFFDALGIE
jgi:hypothetical protein